MKSIAISILGALALTSTASAAAKKDIVDTAVAAGSFKTLAAALQAGGLVDTLKGDGPFTVFAPTDAAFAKLPKGTVESLLEPGNKDKLIDILTYHVVAGKVPAKKAVKLDTATALNKKTIKLEVKGKALFLNSAQVTKADIKCSNGIIHVIDAVLLPPAAKKVGQHSADDVMMVAIHKGVKLFNNGHHGACADVYEQVAQSALRMNDKTICAQDRKVLMTALKMSTKSHCDTTRAWTMRRALNRVMVSSN